jgi:transporter family protein
MEQLQHSSVLYGMIAMGGWGLNYFLLSPTSKKIGALKTAFLVQLFASIFTLLLFPVFKNGFSFGGQFFFLSLLGITGAAGYFFLPKAFSEGEVSIIAPLTSGWAIITAVLSFLFLNERLFFLKGLGIAITILGIVLISTDPKQILKKKIKLLAGVRWALLAAFGMGINSFFLAIFSQKIGWYAANLGLRFWMTMAFLATIFLGKERFSHFFKSMPKLIFLIGLIDVVAFATFNVGLVRGEPAVVSVVASASPLVSIILATIFLKEKTVLIQKAGIFLILLGIISLSLA